MELTLEQIELFKVLIISALLTFGLIYVTKKISEPISEKIIEKFL